MMTTEDLLQLHQETSAKCLAIMRRKNSDYTGGQGVDDPFANFNMASAFGIHPALGVVLRIGDKLQRIRSFANDGALQVTGETIDDACEDIVNYAIILKGIFRAEAAQRSSTVAAAIDNRAYAASLDLPVPQEYRLLEPGEVIQEGDELEFCPGSWASSRAAGQPYWKELVPYRRPL